jgi:hypothetical protein
MTDADPRAAIRAAVRRLMAASTIDADAVSVRRDDIALLLAVCQQRHEELLAS